MRNEDVSNKSITLNSDNSRSLRDRKKKHYSNVPESYIINSAIGLNNGRWSIEEHKKFIIGVFKYGNNWKDIQKTIGTRNCAQARSHGQKFFYKLPKLNLEGITEELCNVKTLHNLYIKSDKDENKKLFYLLGEVAFLNMENDNADSENIQINYKENDVDVSKF
jgi:SHAQKYF class myb-like DNA-binding protein